MEVTLTVEANTLSPEALQDLTRDLCTTLNRESNVRASLGESAAGAGARGMALPLLHVIQIIVPPMLEIGHHLPEVFTHGSGVVLGETVLMILRPYFDRIPVLKAKLQDKSGNEVILSSESVRPQHIDQTVKAIDETLTGLS